MMVTRGGGAARDWLLLTNLILSFLLFFKRENVGPDQTEEAMAFLTFV
jgi:hypothetical protein